ncbi:MAG: hypothetical protein V3U60_01035 [Gammaproteobacteria bacterium]
MKESIKTGLSFGIASGVITTLGLMVGLYSGTHSRIAVIGGILTIAIADAFSDALGIHISEESKNRYSTRQIWEATFATLLSKAAFALTFVIPVLLFRLDVAIWIAVVWGLTLISALSYKLATDSGDSPLIVITEHAVITVVVITITYYLGIWIAMTFAEPQGLSLE